MSLEYKIAFTSATVAIGLLLYLLYYVGWLDE